MSYEIKVSTHESQALFFLIEKGQMLTIRSSNTMYARKLIDQKSWSWIWPSTRSIKNRTQFNLLRLFTRKRFKLTFWQSVR